MVLSILVCTFQILVGAYALYILSASQVMHFGFFNFFLK